jgi:hypothetical protein
MRIPMIGGMLVSVTATFAITADDAVVRREIQSVYDRASAA